MHIDYDRIGMVAQTASIQFPLQRRKRIVERVHEHASHYLDDKHLRTVASHLHGCAPPRCSRGIICRTHQFILPLYEYQSFALIPGMVAKCHHVGSRIEKVVKDIFGDAEPSGRVFTVDHNKMDVVLFNQSGQTIHNRIASRFSDKIP